MRKITEFEIKLPSTKLTDMRKFSIQGCWKKLKLHVRAQNTATVGAFQLFSILTVSVKFKILLVL